ncbi:tetratricopeptide repeat protein [Adhaeribacter swui]|uniref:Tetratricopeptide repeat protein n=1 Tax=Adhaeribacter swui TaxID=2086471 RepID=A0A7G7GBB6_9BACT|nr:tetratricopeptide repeat protein [Adhaeribacter swui]QNF34450.1 tetratricopeptide repeat protein [Adhaeribacter swui]
MRLAVSFLFFFSLVVSVNAQVESLSELKQKIVTTKDTDTLKVILLNDIASKYRYRKPDSALIYARQSIYLARKLNYHYGEAEGLLQMAGIINLAGNYPKALKTILDATKIIENLNFGKEALLVKAYRHRSLLLSNMGNYKSALPFLSLALKLQKQHHLPEIEGTYNNLANVHVRLNNLDSAYFFAENSLRLAKSNPSRQNPYYIGTMGLVLEKSGRNQEAITYAREALKVGSLYGDDNIKIQIYNGLSKLYKKLNSSDSSIFYAQRALQLSKKLGFNNYTLEASKSLVDVFELQNKQDSVLKYLKIMLAAKDNLFSQQKIQEFQIVSFEEEERKKEA